MTRFLPVFCALFLLLLSLPLAAGQKESFGDYEVHYSVIPSTFIQPDIAEQHGLTRSRSIGLLNVSVLKKDADDPGPAKGQTVHLEGHVRNQAQQLQNLTFRRVREGDAIYYLAQFQYREGELMTFRVNASPYGEGDDMPVRFSQELFSD